MEPSEEIKLDHPCVCVLLATHNGSRWIAEQVESIFSQEGVRVRVVLSDDASTDDTVQIVLSRAPHDAVTVLPKLGSRMGNANRNFLRLIRDVDLGSDSHFALSDQDDIWLKEKLATAVEVLQASAASAYSSNAVAVWQDGRRKILMKSGPQRQYDYLFESAGPGCTFVLPRQQFIELQTWVVAAGDALSQVPVHDWLIYAFARTRGWKWHIDSRALILYRQHGANEVGANVGTRAAIKRLRESLDGRYRQRILAVISSAGDNSRVSAMVRRFNAFDRVRLALMAHECRRNPLEAALLALLFLFMRRL
jgi:rhamnosyltransferase